MTTVNNRTEFEEALKSNAQKIKVVGPYANTLAQKYGKKESSNSGIIAGAVGLGSLLLVPFTCGASLLGEGIAAGTIFGVTAGATALTIGTITISTTELMIICGSVLGAMAIAKDYNAKITYEDGKPVFIFTR